MKKITAAILAIPLAALLCTACSTDKESATAEDSGKIETMTKGAADAVVKRIKTPLDKARATQDLGDQRVDEMDKALQDQQ
jgi:hypothetical protein